jgi:hypothetical protein
MPAVIGLVRRAVVLAVPLLLVSCAGAYYSALEKVGIEKRELLVDRVEGARDAQAAAQEQFKDALEEFKALVGYDGGELEAMYSRLSDQSQSCQSRAQAVRDRIAGVESVAEALFREWQGELSQYSDPTLRRKSERQLSETRVRTERLLATMKRAAGRMDPVLAVLNDQVLFLKHNLNAQALGSLDATAASLQTDVTALVREMQGAIAEANAFIATLERR